MWRKYMAALLKDADITDLICRLAELLADYFLKKHLWHGGGQLQVNYQSGVDVWSVRPSSEQTEWRIVGRVCVILEKGYEVMLLVAS